MITHDEQFDSYAKPQLDGRIFRTAVQHDRPVRIPDGSGGFFELMGEKQQLMCDPVIQSGEYSLSVPSETDIRIGDLIMTPHNLFLGQ